jgi:hypothetical protein
MSDPTATTVAQQLGNLPVMTAEVQEAITSGRLRQRTIESERFYPTPSGTNCP